MREQTPAGAPRRPLGRRPLAWMPPDHPLDPDLNRGSRMTAIRGSNATMTDIRSPRPVPMTGSD